MVDDSVREMAEARLKRFWADALQRAAGGSEVISAGAEILAGRLDELGFKGRKGEPYNPESIAAWPAGRRFPGPEVMIAVAIDLDMSLDHYIHGRVIEMSGSEVAVEVERLRERQGVLTGWILEIDEKLADAGIHVGLAERISSLGEVPRERAG